MARAKVTEPDHPGLVTHPAETKLRKCCGTCFGFRPYPNFPSWGDCLPSAAGSPHPRPTPDLGRCSAHKFREGL